MVSLLASGHIQQGMPQIRKFYVFFILLVVYSTFRKISEIRAIVLLWAGIATLSAARSFFQFWRIYQQSQAQHVSFYDFYVGSRITGFMSHWMTFGAEEMIVLLLLAAYLFFSGERRWKTAGWLCAVILGLLHGAWIHAQHLPARLSHRAALSAVVLEEVAGGGGARGGADRRSSWGRTRCGSGLFR